MKPKKGQTYKLIELSGGFYIGNPDVEFPHPMAQPLVIADRTDLVNYFARYLEARESGMNLADAHDAVLKDAVRRMVQ